MTATGGTDPFRGQDAHPIIRTAYASPPVAQSRDFVKSSRSARLPCANNSSSYRLLYGVTRLSILANCVFPLHLRSLRRARGRSARSFERTLRPSSREGLRNFSEMRPRFACKLSCLLMCRKGQRHAALGMGRRAHVAPRSPERGHLIRAGRRGIDLEEAPGALGELD